jgi:hypothetical protein
MPLGRFFLLHFFQHDAYHAAKEMLASQLQHSGTAAFSKPCEAFLETGHPFFFVWENEMIFFRPPRSGAVTIISMPAPR